MKKALITGITGQDGSYLAELLLGKDYEVHGIIRRSSSFNTSRVDHLYQDPHISGTKFFLHFGDLADGTTLSRLVSRIAPDEIYNLGAQSHVRVSFDIPEYTADIDALGTLRLLETIRDFEANNPGKKIKFYQASSSEMFGSAPAPQNELTSFHPRSPYAAAKVYSYHITRNYREAYGIFAVNGILFNHESERRGETFVTRKITRAVARIALGQQKILHLGNLDARRDWGYAPEYMEAAWRMMQYHTPEDFVIGTGVSHRVRDILDIAFARIGITDWQLYIGIDPRYYRPTEVENLIADARKAKELLSWEPKIQFKELIERMTDYDCAALNTPLAPYGKK